MRKSIGVKVIVKISSLRRARRTQNKNDNCAL